MPLGQQTTRAEFLSALRGARLDVRSGTTRIVGRLLSVERVERLDVVFANTLGTGKIPGRGQGFFVQPCEWKHEA